MPCASYIPSECGVGELVAKLPFIGVLSLYLDIFFPLVNPVKKPAKLPMMTRVADPMLTPINTPVPMSLLLPLISLLLPLGFMAVTPTAVASAVAVAVFVTTAVTVTTEAGDISVALDGLNVIRFSARWNPRPRSQQSVLFSEPQQNDPLLHDVISSTLLFSSPFEVHVVLDKQFGDSQVGSVHHSNHQVSCDGSPGTSLLMQSPFDEHVLICSDKVRFVPQHTKRLEQLLEGD